MKLIFLRHGTASQKSSTHTELDDSKRELVKAGRKEVKKILKNYPDVFKNINQIYTSPYLRALETAEMVYEKYSADDFILFEMLEPHHSAKDLSECFQIKNDPKLCLVGHEPLLSECVKVLLKSPDLKIDLVKGGAIILEGETLDKLQLTHVLRP